MKGGGKITNLKLGYEEKRSAHTTGGKLLSMIRKTRKKRGRWSRVGEKLNVGFNTVLRLVKGPRKKRRPAPVSRAQ